MPKSNFKRGQGVDGHDDESDDRAPGDDHFIEGMVLVTHTMSSGNYPPVT